MEYRYQIAEKNDCKMLAETAKEIWEEHFTPLIGPGQVKYMLDRFQSERALKAALDDNYRYILVFDGDENIAYCGVQPREQELFLSKLYVKKKYRKQGIARKLLEQAVDYARQLGKNSIRLTVNKHNDGTISAYYKMGFIKTEEIATDIGEGFVMDDFVMELKL